MVTLVRPQINPSKGTANISLGAAVAPALAQAAMGESITRFGTGQMEEAEAAIRQNNSQANALMDEWRAKVDKAEQTIQYSKGMAKATRLFNEESLNRFNTKVDENGNPTYGALVGDIGNLSDKAREAGLADITNPQARIAFEAQFEGFKTSQLERAGIESHKQQVDVGRNILTDSLSSMMDDAVIKSPDQVLFYHAQAEQILKSSLDSGLISEDEFDTMLDGFKTTVTSESIRNAISQDPDKVKSMLDSVEDATDIGLHSKDLRKLKDETEGQIRDNEVMAKRLEVEEATRAAHMASAKKTELEIGILDGTTGLREVEESREALGEENYLAIRKNLDVEIQKQAEIDLKNNEIATAVSSGKGLSGFAKKDIDTAYKGIIKSFEAHNYRNATLSEKVTLAMPLGTEIEMLSKEVNDTLIYGSDGATAEALGAMAMVDDVHKGAMFDKGLSKEARLIAIDVEAKIKGGMDVPLAIKSAREQYLKLDEATRKINAVDASRSINHKDGLNNRINTKEHLTKTFDAEISDEAISDYRIAAKNYILQGASEENAQKLATKDIQKQYGATSLNGDAQVMKYAPESIYPDIPPKALREDLDVAITSIGLEPSNVRIASDDYTRQVITFTNPETGNKFQSEVVSYAILDEEQMPLVDPETGKLIRWYPDPARINDRIRAPYEAQRKALAAGQLGRASAAENPWMESLNLATSIP